MLLNGKGDITPVRRVHVGTVDGWVKLKVVNLVVEFLDFGHVVDEVREVKGLQCPRLGVLNHADGAASIDNQYFGSVVHSFLVLSF